MSEDSSKSPKKWGIIAAIVGGAIAFFGAQIIVGMLFSVADISFGDGRNDTAEQFYLYGTSSVVTLMIISVIMRFYHARFRDLGLGKFRLIHVGYALMALPIYIATSIAINTVAVIILPNLNFDQQQDLGSFAQAASPVELILVFFALVVLPPFVEELLFRGFIFKGFLRRLSPIFAAILTSALFGLAHQQANVALDTFALSLVLCYLTYKANSLWPAILLHGVKNFIAFFFLFIMTIEEFSQILMQNL